MILFEKIKLFFYKRVNRPCAKSFDHYAPRPGCGERGRVSGQSAKTFGNDYKLSWQGLKKGRRIHPQEKLSSNFYFVSAGSQDELQNGVNRRLELEEGFGRF
jgi:hypothetical protein